MDEVMQFLDDAGVYFISSVGDDGKPHVRPFGSRVIHDGKFYIMMGFPKPVYDQVMANPYVELGAIGKERAWLRVSAKAVPELDVEKRRDLLTAFGGPMPKDPDVQMVFELTEVTATINAGENPKVITW